VLRDSLRPATFHVLGRVNRHNVRIRGAEKPVVLARPELCLPSYTSIHREFLIRFIGGLLVGVLRNFASEGGLK